MTPRVVHLRAERRSDSGVVATPTPRLSWIVDSTDPWIQSRVEIRAGSESVELGTRDSVLVAWPFAPLVAGECREVAVRAHAASGAVTEWSGPLAVEAGFLAADAWIAQPIGLDRPERPAHPVRLRRIVEVRGGLRRARLHWTALGVARLRINGERVDDGELGPGWTAYRERLIHESVEVTRLLGEGPNVLAAELAGCWYTEEYGFHDAVARVYGEQPRLLAQLVLEYADGGIETVATDPTWLASGTGPLIDSGLYAGESADLRRVEPGWDRPGAPLAGWSPVAVGADHPVPVPEARSVPPVRAVAEVPVAAVLEAPDGGRILDFGENLVGRLRLRVVVPAGTEVVLRHAEVLEGGDLALRPLRRAAATDRVVFRGDADGEEWEPAFTFHGFRYARVNGVPGGVDPGAVTAVVLASDLERTGWFSSSHELLDTLHENVVRSMRGNFLAIPTDCPQRDERLGWTGDIQVFAPTAAFLGDVGAFVASWLRDLALEQAPDGAVPMVVPDVLRGTFPVGAAAAWADAATIVPWVLYERTGDVGVLRDQYASMAAWGGFLMARAEHDGLWQGQLQLGDWLDPTAPPDRPFLARTDADIVASAYLVRSLGILADTAGILHQHEDRARFAAAADHARLAFRDTFVTPSGRMMSDAPTAYALALRFDLVTDPGTRQALGDRLAELVRRGGYRIPTGFVGTPLIADALVDTGHPAVAARLLLATECPSWLYPVTQGATTIWERWDSLLEDGTVNPGEMTSFNHYALGAVADFLHRRVAGLAPAEPGFRRLVLEPVPLPGLTRAAARHRTPYGDASISWHLDGDELVVHAVVPGNTTADFLSPDGSSTTVGSGTHSWRVPHRLPGPAAPVRLGLESTTAAVIDHPAAYLAFLAVLEEFDPGFARGVRRDTVWSDDRTVREALAFAPPPVLDAVAAALDSVSSR